jgi:hypothetical protein
MPKLTLLIILFTLVGLLAFAQQPIKGRVLENKTRVGLISITVQNLRTKEIIKTDAEGRFTIKVSLNDLLTFKGFAYETDTLLVTRYSDFQVFLQPQQHLLKDVKVTGRDGPSLIVKDPYFHGQTTAYQTDDNGNFKGGLKFRLWYWKKDERKKKRYQKMFKDEQVMSQIANVFNSKSLTRYIPLRGAEMDNFIRLYTPSVKVYQGNSFVLTDYLNACYKKFVQLPVEKRQINPDSAMFRQ